MLSKQQGRRRFILKGQAAVSWSSGGDDLQPELLAAPFVCGRSNTVQSAQTALLFWRVALIILNVFFNLRRKKFKDVSETDILMEMIV